MLSPVSLSEDEGNVCALPSGEQVKLRERFSSSGLYKIGAPPVPVWTVNWYGEKGLVRMSRDGRYLVRVNRFGGGGYGEPVSSYWCLRFYDSGAQIKSYNTDELVDYPSLMEFTSSDWHFLWIDYSVYRADVHDGIIDLKTTTRESYRFDVTTGETIGQFRFWRWMARGSMALLTVFGLIAGWFVCRRRAAKRRRPLSSPPAQPWRLVFGVRAIFVVTTLIAGLLGVYLVAAHVAVLLTSATVAVLLSYLAVRTRRRALSHPSGLMARCRRVTLWLVVSTSWLSFYALSIAPAMALAWYCGAPHDVRMVILQVVYAPVWWLYHNTPIHGWEMVGFYWRGWGF